MVSDLSPEEIEKKIVETNILFVDAWAPWCGPCLALGPILEELENKYADDDDISFVKINTQEHRSFAAANNIVAIPCVLVYKDGKPAEVNEENPRTGEKQVTDRIIGLRPAEYYEDVIEQLL
ncbi:thioredoxin [Candidatus Thorarchaeota archaeon]|nr:MAG: thioredoxin [Candidatus Thorarchaeota archaeon]